MTSATSEFFELTWFPSHEQAPRPVNVGYAIEDTEAWWRDWVSSFDV